jgi:hypothetical protein
LPLLPSPLQDGKLLKSVARALGKDATPYDGDMLCLHPPFALPVGHNDGSVVSSAASSSFDDAGRYTTAAGHTVWINRHEGTNLTRFEDDEW